MTLSEDKPVRSVRFGRISRISFMVAAFGFFVGTEYGWAWLITAALVSGASAFISGALEIHLRRRGEALEGIGRWHSDWGIALFPLSFTLLIAGFTLLAFGLLRVVGLDRDFINYLYRRPGLALSALGIALIGAGAAVVIGRKTWRDSRWDMVLYLPARLAGLGLLLVGLLLVVLGLVELIQPAGFDEWMRATLGPFNPLR